VTQATNLPAVRRGGSLRRFWVLLVSVATWFGALLLLGTGISPGLGEPTETEWGLRVLLVAAGLAVATLPVLVFALPARRRARSFVAAVTAGRPEVPALPAFETWAGPQPMFQRLQLTSYTVLAPPLLLLAGSAVYGFVLAEPVAGVVFTVLALIPWGFAVVTWRLPRRVRANVAAGLALGQVVPVRVERRIDQRKTVGDSFHSWFDAVLPDGQHLTLRTPVHHVWAADARGVVDAADLVLVMGEDGHQGLLLSPCRPQDPVWLLGPVPLTRVPRRVHQDFTGELPEG
jgi:hypothetical protein